MPKQPPLILKVQLPLFSNDPDAPALIYGKGRKDMRWLKASDLPRDVTAAVERGLGKAYFYASLTAADELVFGVQAPAHRW